MSLFRKSLPQPLFLLAAATTLVLGACGYPTFGFDSGGTGGGGGIVTGAGGMGGLGGGTMGTGGDPATSSVSSSASASTTGTGCMTTGMSTCTPTCGCTATQKCAVTSETAGTMTCIAAGPVAPWAKCNSNKDCSATAWCDHLLQVCKPICEGVADCPPNAQCIPAKQADGVTDVTGITVCTAHCDPISAAPCGANITCFYDFDTVEFDCSVTPNLSENVACTSSNDCAKGLVCAGVDPDFVCKQWCTPIDSMNKNGTCPSARPYCDPVAVNVTYEGTSYGICNP